VNAHTSWSNELAKHIVLLLGASIVILPFYLMLSFSFKSPAEIQSISGGFFGAQEIMTDQFCVKQGKPPEQCQMLPIVYNYTAAFSEAPLLRYLLWYSGWCFFVCLFRCTPSHYRFTLCWQNLG